jgi:hypothetical protein
MVPSGWSNRLLSVDNLIFSPGSIMVGVRAIWPQDSIFWSAAISTRAIFESDAIQSVSMKCKPGAIMNAGLSSTPGYGRIGSDPVEKKFGIFFQSGNLEVYEHPGFHENYYKGTWDLQSETDVFEIRVTGTTVEYLKNDVLFYTSAHAATFPLWLHVELNRRDNEDPSINHLSDVTMTASPYVPDPRCPVGYTYSTQDVGSSEWSYPGDKIEDCAAACEARTGDACTSFEYDFPGNQNWKCGIATRHNWYDPMYGGRGSAGERSVTGLTEWASCIRWQLGYDGYAGSA